MQGLYYLLALVGFGFIANWFIQNDRLPPGEPTKGLLRMKPTADDAPNPAPDRQRKSSRVSRRN
jgi:hypothetical protein